MGIDPSQAEEGAEFHSHTYAINKHEKNEERKEELINSHLQLELFLNSIDTVFNISVKYKEDI